MTAMTRLIHLDTDIGGDTDDLCALVMLLGWPEVELSGITTSAEVGGMRAGIVHAVLALAGRAGIPIAAGAGGSLGGFLAPSAITDPARYWPEPIAAQPGAPGAALDLLAASIGRGATVVAIGPFTNLALLEVARPGLLASAEVVVMGGYVAPPGPGLPALGADSDWNVQSDTLAARIVFARCNPLIVPLSVTLQVALQASHLPALRASGPLGRLLAIQGERYATDHAHHALALQHAALPADLLNFQHDALACAVAAGWDGVSIDTVPLLPVFDGRWLSLAASPEGKAMRVVTAVDRERFAADWLRAVERAVTPTPGPSPSRR